MQIDHSGKVHETIRFVLNKRKSSFAADKNKEIVMKITVAGDVKDVKEGITISELIVAENVETPEYVSVSVNEEFVQKDAFESTQLKEGDVVEFLYFMGGGR